MINHNNLIKIKEEERINNKTIEIILEKGEFMYINRHGKDVKFNL